MKVTSGSVEDISLNSNHSEERDNLQDSCDDVRSGRLDKQEDACKDLPEPLDLTHSGTDTIDNNIKKEADIDVLEKELKIVPDGRKQQEGKKGSVSLNLKKSPSSSGPPLTPSRPCSCKLTHFIWRHSLVLRIMNTVPPLVIMYQANKIKRHGYIVYYYFY